MSSRNDHNNRLIKEKSPYLLQHAHNPVDWYPWGEEAFKKSKKEDKPIFLSIGYSTCHWCHVMEEESFEDKEIARIINQYFVPIKVDREERPDIDQAYMTAVTALTGQGGWPLTAFLTPDKKPFFGGTYFPPFAKWGQPGLTDVLQSIHQAWSTRREELIQSSQSITDWLKQNKKLDNKEQSLDEEVFDRAFVEYTKAFDERYGGFGHAPKFPSSQNLNFLLRYGQRKDEKKAVKMVEVTLKKMAQGGMYDQIGGGFHRYSTDEQWQIPHFEKMLYDQANLSIAYLEAYQATQDKFFASIAASIFDYVLRDLRDPQGGFYSAEDADSLEPGDENTGSKKEGAFYLFKWEELETILEKEELRALSYHYGLQKTGNALYDPHEEFIGKNVLFIQHDMEDTAKYFGKDMASMGQTIDRAKEKLLKVRSQRTRPHCDDKVLVDWNGFMIASLAMGGKVLGREYLTKAAVKAVQFIKTHLIDKKGRLLHRYRDGEAAILGTLNDYTYLIFGLMEVYEATGEIEHLEWAVQLTQEMINLFGDEEGGGFYLTAHDTEEVLFRQKDIYDGAFPSANAVAALNLIRLYHITLNKDYEDKAMKLFQASAATLKEHPTAYASLLAAYDFALGASMEIVLAYTEKSNSVEDLARVINRGFYPFKVMIFHSADRKDSARILKVAPFVAEQKVLDGRPTVYVCQDHVCRLPIHTQSQLDKLLKEFKWRRK